MPNERLPHRAGRAPGARRTWGPAMTVRLRLALTIFVIGVCTALGVLVTVAMAFQRF